MSWPSESARPSGWMSFIYLFSCDTSVTFVGKQFCYLRHASHSTVFAAALIDIDDYEACSQTHCDSACALARITWPHCKICQI